MGTSIFPCGCSISSDMFNSNILAVLPCPEHAENEAVQAAMRVLVKAIKAIQDEEDGMPLP